MRAVTVALITAAALLVGGLLWSSLVYWRRKRPVTVRSLFAVVLGCGILCRLAYVFFTPTFYAPDEQAHFNYLKQLVDDKSFPVQTGKLGDAANDWENHQPPFYYLLLTPVYGVVQALFHNQTATVLALRLFSFLLWLLNVWYAMLFLKRMQITDEFVRLFLLAMICLLPTYVFISSVINNDNLLITLGGAMLCLIVRREPAVKQSLLTGLLLGLALLTKQSAVVFFPVIFLRLALEAWKRQLSWRVAFTHVAIMLGLATLIYFPWALRNWLVYHTLTPEHLVVAPKTWPSAAYGLASAAHNLFKTFWSVSGLSNDVGYPFPVIGLALIALGFAITQLDLKLEPKLDALRGAVNDSLLTALLIAVAINIVLALRIGYLFGMGQGRHLFPLLFPLALFLAARLRPLPLKNLEVHAAGFWITYAVGFTTFSLCCFP